MSMDDGTAPYYRKTIQGETRSCLLCHKNGGDGGKCKVYVKEISDGGHICDACETKEDLEKAEKETRDNEPAIIKYSDADSADRFIKQYGNDIRFCVEEDKFYIWNGHAWQQDIKNVVASMIKEMLDTYRKNEEDNYNKALEGKNDALACKAPNEVIAKWDATINVVKAYLRKLTTSGAFENTMRRCQRDYTNIKVQLTEFDRNNDLFNAENCTLDLTPESLLTDSKLVLKEQCRDDMITRMAPVVYDPMVSIKPYIDMLSDVYYGDKELIKNHLQMRGLGLVGRTVKYLSVSVGAPDSGKSALKNIERSVYGDVEQHGYSKETSIETFLKRRNPGELRADLVSIRAARVVWTSEADRGMEIDAELVKKMTGKDKITARAPYMRAEISYEPTFKIFMLCNEAPYMPPDNEGMMSRVLIVPYRVTFKKQANPDMPFEKNIDLDRIRYFETPEGKSCILNAWITGLRDYYLNNELTIGTEITKNTAAYKNEIDDVKTFVMLATIIEPMGYITKRDLYTAYQKFRADEGKTAYVMSDKKFTREIRKMLEKSYPGKLPNQIEGFDTKGSSRVWFGIRLRTDADELTDQYIQRMNNDTTLVI